MTPGLSQRTRQLLDSLFDPIDIDEACLWLEEECGNNLPFCDDSDEILVGPDVPAKDRVPYASSASNSRTRHDHGVFDRVTLDARVLFNADGAHYISDDD